MGNKFGSNSNKKLQSSFDNFKSKYIKKSNLKEEISNPTSPHHKCPHHKTVTILVLHHWIKKLKLTYKTPIEIFQIIETYFTIRKHPSFIAKFENDKL